MPTPTPTELAGLDYETTSAAAASGMTGQEFAQEIRERGHRFRHWQAWPAPDGAVGPGSEPRRANGRIYVEADLPDTVRCILYRTQRDFWDAEFGAIAAGTMAVSVMPDEAELARLDWLSFPDVTWLRRQIVQRALSGAVDALLNVPVTSIAAVLSGGNIVAPESYQVATDGSGIKWLANTPSAGAFYTVKYRQEPRFEFTGADDKGVVQIGSDGVFLPQRGALRLMAAGEF